MAAVYWGLLYSSVILVIVPYNICRIYDLEVDRLSIDMNHVQVNGIMITRVLNKFENYIFDLTFSQQRYFIS